MPATSILARTRTSGVSMSSCSETMSSATSRCGTTRPTRPCSGHRRRRTGPLRGRRRPGRGRVPRCSRVPTARLPSRRCVELVLAGGGIEQVGRHGGVHRQAGDVDAQRQQRAHHLLDVVADDVTARATEHGVELLGSPSPRSGGRPAPSPASPFPAARTSPTRSLRPGTPQPSRRHAHFAVAQGAQVGHRLVGRGRNTYLALRHGDRLVVHRVVVQCTGVLRERVFGLQGRCGPPTCRFARARPTAAGRRCGPTPSSARSGRTRLPRPHGPTRRAGAR